MPADLLHQKSKMLILIFIFSESVFFAFLISAFVLYHGDSRVGANPWQDLDPVKTGMYSIVLWSSSLTMWFAERSLRAMKLSRVKRWLEATVLLGAIFLVGTGREYHDLFEKSITPRTNLFATTFFTTTGFHALHVLIGLTVLLILRGLAAGQFGKQEYQRQGFEAASYYWHFVDAVWVAVFFTIYVWGTR
jgi:heme/copper-type cytochrome/quinol oxidase subunit 3